MVQDVASAGRGGGNRRGGRGGLRILGGHRARHGRWVFVALDGRRVARRAGRVGGCVEPPVPTGRSVEWSRFGQRIQRCPEPAIGCSGCRACCLGDFRIPGGDRPDSRSRPGLVQAGLRWERCRSAAARSRSYPDDGIARSDRQLCSGRAPIRGSRSSASPDRRRRRRSAHRRGSRTARLDVPRRRSGSDRSDRHGCARCGSAPSGARTDAIGPDSDHVLAGGWPFQTVCRVRDARRRQALTRGWRYRPVHEAAYADLPSAHLG